MRTITIYPESNPTQPPTSKSNNNYYAALQYGSNDYSDDETVIMTNNTVKNPMDEESTVETAYSVWGSDEESELDKGVGGLDPAHQDSERVNGQENARERPALIVIDNKASLGRTAREDLASQSIVSPQIPFARIVVLREDRAMKTNPYQSHGMPNYQLRVMKKGGKN